MNKFLKIIIILIIVSAILSFIFLFKKDQSIQLAGKEIKEYQGENLSSINDFRENSINGPQYIDQGDYQLEISGLVEKPVFYSYDQLINKFQSYKKTTTLFCVEGWDVKILWQGFLVSDLIKEVQPKPETKTIIFYAVDGYSTSFPVEYLTDNEVLMAHKMNDVVLPPERGFPFQLVAEDKWGYKWIKWITKIEFSDQEDYQGYWESRGYSNEGDLNKNFLK